MDYERDLRKRFPKLIHCAVSGFGPDGPLGGLPGYDAAIQAMTGLMSGERRARTVPPRASALPVVDMVTGLKRAPPAFCSHLPNARRAAVASRSISRCTTAASRCCIRICRTISARAPHAAAQRQTRIPTSRRTTAIAPRPRADLSRGGQRPAVSRSCARHLGAARTRADDPRYVRQPQPPARIASH